MAGIEEALTAALTAASGVSALVAARVFPAGGRQGAAYPYVTWQRISTGNAGHLDGASDLDWPLFQIDAWGETAASVLAVASALRSAIDGQELTGAGLTFSATFQDQRGPAPDDETRKWRVSQDFYLWHERT